MGNKKWYEYLLTAKENPNGASTDTEIVEEDDESQFVAVPAPPPGKNAVVAAAVAEALSRTTQPPPAPSGLPIMSPDNEPHFLEIPKPPVCNSHIDVLPDARGTELQEVVDSALRRIQLLQQQERETARDLEALERRIAEENERITEDLAAIVEEHNHRIQSNTETIGRMKAQFLAWRVQVKEEEQKLAEVLSYFSGALAEQTESSKDEND